MSEAITKIVGACVDKEPTIACLKQSVIHKSQAGTYLVATDTFRLACYCISTDPVEEESTTDTLGIPIESTYRNWQRVVPDPSQFVLALRLNVNDLRDAITRIMPTAKLNGNCVVFEYSQGLFTVSATSAIDSADYSKAETVIELCDDCIEWKQPNDGSLVTALNAQHVLDALPKLKPWDRIAVTLNLLDRPLCKPAVLSYERENGGEFAGLKVVMMPMARKIAQRPQPRPIEAKEEVAA